MIMSPSATASTNFVSNADRGDLYLSSKKLTPALGTWSKKELDLGSILSAFQVRADNYEGSRLSEVFNSGDG
jgi:hypothetical protein